jgi:hypothetical protein
MRIAAIGIERALDAAMVRTHDANARAHRRAGEVDDERQGFHRGLPFRCGVSDLGKPVM